VGGECSQQLLSILPLLHVQLLKWIGFCFCSLNTRNNSRS